MNSELEVNNIIKSIGKNSLIYGVSTALQPLGGFILLPLYSEYFEKSEFGIYTLILLISTIFSTVFYLGINSAFIRSYYDYDSEEDRIKVFNTSLFILLIGLFLQVLICILAAEFLSVSILKDESYVGILTISVITSGVGFVNTGFLNYLRVKEKALKYTLVSFFSLVINIALTLYLFEYSSKSINSPIYSALFSQSLTLILLIFIHIKDINLFNINKSEIKTLLHFGLPSILAGITIMVGEWGDKFLINEFLHKDELGIFSMGFRIAMIYNVIVAMPFALVWSPLMIKIRTYSNAKLIFSRVAYLYFAFSLVFIFTVHVILEPILTLLGFHSKFYDSLNYVPLLMMALALGSLQNIYSAGITFARKPIIFAFIYLAVGCANFFASYYAIIKYGIFGIIITFILFKLITSIAIYYFSSKHFKFQIFDFGYLKLITLLLAGIFLYMNYFTNYYSFTFLFIYLLIYFIYLCKDKILYIITSFKKSI
ncbi:MAG: oligosaccharide flippase family protein [Verrucomicrobia bacterium]|nr:oligosaccharide flippase family protein [Verrucomicrobiota bacterium]